MGIEVFDDFMETDGAELALEQNKLRQSLNLLKQRLEAERWLVYFELESRQQVGKVMCDRMWGQVLV